MYELIQVSEHCYYFDCPAKIGLVRVSDKEVLLIDSGNDKGAAKKVLRSINDNGWTLRAVLNTHSHADHIGGNQFLQSQTGCPIYAPDVEQCFVRHPLLEPLYLYGGFPPRELRSKFILAKESDAALLTNDVLPPDMRVIELPGHSFHMVGFSAPEHVLYLADCVASKETLAKYQVSFLVDVEQYLQTLDMIQTMDAEFFIPSHAAPTKDIAPLAKLNAEKVYEIAEKIVSFCAEPLPFETLLQRLFSHYQLTMTMEQRYLVGSTVQSYLTWLKNKGELICLFDNNLLLWQKA